jgi:chloramphenicol-sensitive protein RarD
MDAKQTRVGILLALAAYFIWGIAPAYFKLIYYVPADEILTHRVIWSFFFMVALISISRQWPQVKRLLKTPKRCSCWRSLRCWWAATGCCLSGR